MHNGKDAHEPADLGQKVSREVMRPAGEGKNLAGGGRTVLLVEDYKDTSELLKSWLEWQGYEVLCAIDGWEGLRLALRRRPDLVLLDLSLPGLDGLTVANIIRAHEELVYMPIVAITAYESVYQEAEAAVARCNAYLPKPLELERLQLVMNRLLHGG